MVDSMPLLRLLDLVPHEVTQDNSLDGISIDPFPFVSNTYCNNRTTAEIDEIVPMSGCNDSHLKACILATLESVWSIPKMFPAQHNAVFCLILPICPNHLAMIQRAGAGKTHILRMLGIIEGGIILIFIPLFTLSAKVMAKFTCTNKQFGAVMMQHLDQLYDANKHVYQDLLKHCHGLFQSTSMTLFIFLSPQFLINHSDAQDVFIE